MDRDEVAPSLSQAQKLHRLSAVDKIDDSAIEAVMLVDKPMYSTIIFRRNTLEKYFPEGTSGQEIEQTILRLLTTCKRSVKTKNLRYGKIIAITKHPSASRRFFIAKELMQHEFL